jgi:hypothetical protein
MNRQSIRTGAAKVPAALFIPGSSINGQGTSPSQCDTVVPQCAGTNGAAPNNE